MRMCEQVTVGRASEDRIGEIENEEVLRDEILCSELRRTRV